MTPTRHRSITAWLCGVALMAALGLSGCAHVNSVSTTSIPADRSKPVEAETSKFLFMFINFNNDYVNELTEKLAAQCPDGRVEGVLTKLEYVTWFPVFAYSVHVEATGYCVDGAQVRAATPAPPAPAPTSPAAPPAAAPATPSDTPAPASAPDAIQEDEP